MLVSAIAKLNTVDHNKSKSAKNTFHGDKNMSSKNTSSTAKKNVLLNNRELTKSANNKLNYLA